MNRSLLPHEEGNSSKMEQALTSVPYFCAPIKRATLVKVHSVNEVDIVATVQCNDGSANERQRSRWCARLRRIRMNRQRQHNADTIPQARFRIRLEGSENTSANARANASAQNRELNKQRLHAVICELEGSAVACCLRADDNTGQVVGKLYRLFDGSRDRPTNNISSTECTEADVAECLASAFAPMSESFCSLADRTARAPTDTRTAQAPTNTPTAQAPTNTPTAQAPTNTRPPARLAVLPRIPLSAKSKTCPAGA